MESARAAEDASAMRRSQMDAADSGGIIAMDCAHEHAAPMLGLVLADNLILLSVFWELTTISSFLLIGFEHEQHGARRAALQALLVTALGGLTFKKRIGALFTITSDGGLLLNTGLPNSFRLLCATGTFYSYEESRHAGCL